MERNSSKDDRRTEARRQVTPKGEVIVEVPFTEAQARALLTLDLGFGCTREIADTVAGAGALLKASLDYAVARAKRYDARPDVVEIDYVCRDIGYGVESGTARGIWGERDWTGKRMFYKEGGPTLYFFDDEVVDPDVAHKRRQGE